MCNQLIGSCTGLICIHSLYVYDKIRENSLFFWNPATRLISKKLGIFHGNVDSTNFTFGYDYSTNTYKVVCFELESGRRNSQGILVKVFTLGDNLWRDIQRLPVDVITLHSRFHNSNDGVNLNDTLNWIALHDNHTQFYDPEVVTVEKFMILSLDLATEKYFPL
ncbi:F-box/kelch-repeat protein At3g23880-like [Lotus japonicus]|uniref:F-box/kelch-repeat protein At3g23880-like n=1 Tax=Lotus japonicus TaxID=34305 RepID=UPI002591059C|nr:F-box/kelch-repeat protein At3g23880-like [Lotus japonicus]